MNYILFDNSRQQLMPFTLSRPVCEIRVGILTIKQKWELYLNASCSYECELYLQAKYPKLTASDNVYINATVFPDADLVVAIKNLKIGEALLREGNILALRTTDTTSTTTSKLTTDYKNPVSSINRIWHIFGKCDEQLRADFKLLTNGRNSLQLNSSNRLVGNTDDLFIEEGATVNCAIINTQTGPVYIAKDAEVMEGAMIRGPFALGEHATLKMGAKIYGATSIGPHCKVGGEVSNSVFFGFSNKAHDGFVGNAVIGEWCNLGADSNNSNLKNNYGNVKVYDYASQNMVDTGLQFCGLFMADHAKCAINTQFNTGTVVGFASNVFGGDFPPKFIPDFSWGGAKGFEKFDLQKAIALAKNVYARRSMTVTDADVAIFEAINEMAKNTNG
nr:GlmU family protein [Bacteroidota bacterium]